MVGRHCGRGHTHAFTVSGHGIFEPGTFRGKRRIAKATNAYAGCQHRATLQACFCHRCFCAADASTPVRRERRQNNTGMEKSRKIDEVNAAKQAAGNRPAERQASSCWASMSRLKAMRLSSATAAK